MLFFCCHHYHHHHHHQHHNHPSESLPSTPFSINRKGGMASRTTDIVTQRLNLHRGHFSEHGIGFWFSSQKLLHQIEGYNRTV